MKKSTFTICLVVCVVASLIVSGCRGKDNFKSCEWGYERLTPEGYTDFLKKVQKNEPNVEEGGCKEVNEPYNLLPAELKEKIQGSIGALNTCDIVKYYSYYDLPTLFQFCKGNIKRSEHPEYFSGDPNVKYEVEETGEFLKDVNSFGAFRTLLIHRITSDLFALDKLERNFKIRPGSVKVSSDNKRVFLWVFDDDPSTSYTGGEDEWSYYGGQWWKIQ